MENRKARKKISKKVDITKPLEPIDILKFGTDEDPCFGKLHDLTEDACKRCGDSHICQIVCNQSTLKLRANEENTTRFKDLELAKGDTNNKQLKKYIKSKLEKGMVSVKLTKLVLVKFKELNLSKAEVKELIKKYK